MLFLCFVRVCACEGLTKNVSSLTSLLGVSTSRAEKENCAKAARNRGQCCTWKYLSIARDFNRLFCSNKIYIFTRLLRKVQFQCSPQVHRGSLTGNVLGRPTSFPGPFPYLECEVVGRPDSRLDLLVAKNKKSMGLFSPKFALDEERTFS